MTSKTCAICGKEFTTGNARKLYCSLSCREAGRKLQRLKWEDENPAYMADYMRLYRRKQKQKGVLKSGRPYTD